MASLQIYMILYIAKYLKKSICDLFNKTNKELDDAKAMNLNKKKLDIFFSNYRKDKFLNKCYLKFINNLIKYTELYITDNKFDYYDKLLNSLAHVIDFHKTTIYINIDGESNANTHFSTQGIILVNSFDFVELNAIYYELIYQ